MCETPASTSSTPHERLPGRCADRPPRQTAFQNNRPATSPFRRPDADAASASTVSNTDAALRRVQTLERHHGHRTRHPPAGRVGELVLGAPCLAFVDHCSAQESSRACDRRACDVPEVVPQDWLAACAADRVCERGCHSVVGVAAAGLR